MREILSGLPLETADELIVGFETSDDAAVYRLNDEQAALLSVDFFTPIVDDPRDFGRIAAANSLSDIYAMGGQPLAVLNLLALPSGLPPQVAREMLAGSGEVVREAGALVVGGHTIEDAEPKFGLAVFGMVHPQAVVRNVGALPGDALVLTKSLGTGIMTTALKRGLESEDSVRVVIESMAHLNRASAAAMTEVGVHAATDVTGFGLVGHLHEMLEGSGVSARVDTARVPVFDRALDYAADLVCPGRTRDLLEFLDPVTRWGSAGIEWRSLLTDPQTSGGLLMAVAPERLGALMGALDERGERGHVVGEVLAGDPGTVDVA